MEECKLSGNDLNTLSGALLEMKDQLIYELGQKGVTATYSSSTGLLGLIAKIGDIQTGGGGSCYHIEFEQSSYIAVGGSATVSVYLQSNYAPLSGATVSISGSDGSSYTCITNSSGVASKTITCSANITLTASYSNVSDTASVTYSNNIFFDDCSANNVSQYGSSVMITGGTSTLSFSTDHYVMSGGGDFNGFVIPNATGYDNVKVRVKFKLSKSSDAYNQFGLCVCNGTTYTTNEGLRVRGDKKFQVFNFRPSEYESTIYTHSSALNSDYFYVELIKQGTSITRKLYDKNLNQLATNTGTCNSYSNPNYLFYHLTQKGTSYTTNIQEIKVESIS